MGRLGPRLTCRRLAPTNSVNRNNSGCKFRASRRPVCRVSWAVEWRSRPAILCTAPNLRCSHHAPRSATRPGQYAQRVSRAKLNGDALPVRLSYVKKRGTHPLRKAHRQAPFRCAHDPPREDRATREPSTIGRNDASCGDHPEMALQHRAAAAGRRSHAGFVTWMIQIGCC